LSHIKARPIDRPKMRVWPGWLLADDRDRRMEWPLALVGLCIGLLLLLAGLVAFGRAQRRRRQQILREDALKQIYGAKHEGRTVTCAELGGRLGLSPASTLRLARDLEAAGYLRSRAGVLELTETGEHLGRHVLRGHRLWERYLSDEGQLPLDRLHDAAERAEHRLAAGEPRPWRIIWGTPAPIRTAT
jgi:hypothetical protein